MECCEFCNKTLRNSKEDSVCGACDTKYLGLHTRAMAKKERAWGAKHKCRRCSTSLPLSRYYLCTTCDPVDERPSDDGDLDYWAFDQLGFTAAPPPEKIRKDRPIPAQAICRGCKVMKDSNEFSLNHRAANGLQSRCKGCFYIYNRDRWAAKKEQLNALREMQAKSGA